MTFKCVWLRFIDSINIYKNVLQHQVTSVLQFAKYNTNMIFHRKKKKFMIIGNERKRLEDWHFNETAQNRSMHQNKFNSFNWRHWNNGKHHYLTQTNTKKKTSEIYNLLDLMQTNLSNEKNSISLFWLDINIFSRPYDICFFFFVCSK